METNLFKPHIAQAAFQYAIKLRLALNYRSSHFYFPSVEISGMCKPCLVKQTVILYINDN